MTTIEKQIPTLKGILPKEYSRPDIDPLNLGKLIEIIDSLKPIEIQDKNNDLLGRVYEYCLGQFALSEGRKGGQFYTPSCIVKLLVEMLEPYNGRIYDPCCGSGGMFVQSERFIQAHGQNAKKEQPGPLKNTTIYGQESNFTTYRLCRMNLAIRGIEAANIKWNNQGSFLKDEHRNLKADYILANPPFNDSDWNGGLLKEDPRWTYGLPPASNANFAWLQHIVFHLSRRGTAGVVLSNGSLSTQTAGEGVIRKNMVEERMIDCIVGLPNRLFYNTGIPACVWFLDRTKKNRGYRKNEILLIEARSMGHMISRKNRELSNEDINTIAGIYHNWRNKDGDYRDIKGLCKSALIRKIKQQEYLLAPARYVGTQEEIENDIIPFSQKIKEFRNIMKKGEEFDRHILAEMENLKLFEV